MSNASTTKQEISPTLTKAVFPASLNLPSQQSIPDALSVDVEDYFHVEAFADRIRPDTWDQYPSRVVDNTRKVLEVFARAGTRGTFFILGWVAERYPYLVREIQAAGHELGCHSYLHQCVWRLTPEQFRSDTRRALSAIQQAGGALVTGYRAPTFSIVERTMWALEILAEEGLHYDSSIFPVRHDVYGIPSAPRRAFRWELSNGLSLPELPMSTLRVLGCNLPLGGGGYLRLLPMAYTRWGQRALNRQQVPLQLYLHPWEVDPDQPRLPGRWKSRLRHYHNLGRMQSRIEQVLKHGKFAALGDVLAAYGGAEALASLATSHLTREISSESCSLVKKRSSSAV
ncbi:MAG: XrtA system polysaccharide deacetylase [Candidatus Korobacteraceae bacterium]